VVQCVTYAAIGMPIGMLGAGWPDARGRFDATTGALGLVAAAYGVGRLVTAPTALTILRRWPMRTASTAFGAGLTLAVASVAVVRSYAALVVAFAAIGLLSGCLDSLGNRYQSVVRDVGSAGLMFGSFGVGSTLGPAVVATFGWAPAYAASAVLTGTAVALVSSRRVTWPADLRPAAAGSTSAAAAAPSSASKVPFGVVALSLALFFVYCGIEVVTANWAASYLEGGRGLSAGAAAWAMSGFWAGITLGRLGLGRLSSLGSGLRPSQLLSLMAIGVAAVYVAIPLLPPPAAVAALALAGLALAGAFPTLMSTTADRVGVAAAGRVTGLQLFVANLAATGLTVLVGFGVDARGDAVVGLALAALALLGLPLVWRARPVHAPQPAIDVPAPEPTAVD
jgi:fucose permease